MGEAHSAKQEKGEAKKDEDVDYLLGTSFVFVFVLPIIINGCDSSDLRGLLGSRNSQSMDVLFIQYILLSRPPTK
jgi:hypothetical protein